jgi:ABC-2 type transport system permease protein
MFRKFAALVMRELKTWTRSPALFLSFLVGPAIWILIFGTALNSVLSGSSGITSTLQGAPNYFDFIASGMLVVVPMTFAGRAGASIFADRLTGYLDRLLVSPTTRETIVLSKILASMILGAVQAGIILVVAAIFGLRVAALPFTSLWILVASIFLLGYGFSSVFLMVSMRIRRWPTQQMATTFLTTPIMFLSNAFYPNSSIPSWIRDLTLLNPLSYGISLSRSILFQSGSSLPGGVMADLDALVIFAAACSVALVMTTRKLL